MKAIRAVSARENSESKQCHIPREIAEVRATIKDMKDTRVVLPTMSLFKSPTWPVQKTNGPGERQLTIENSIK